MTEFDALLAEGHERLTGKDYVAAAKAFVAAARLDAKSFAAVRGLGIAMSFINDKSATAFSYLELAAELNGGQLDAEALQAYGLSLAYGGQADRAAAVFDSLARNDGSSLHYLLRLEQHWQRGDMAATQRAAHDLLTHPDCWDPAVDTHAVLAPRLVLNTVIGEQSTRLDLICKARALGWPVPEVLVLNAYGKIANRAMLDYWRPHFAMIEDVIIPPHSMKIFPTFAYRAGDGDAYPKNLAYALVNREWAKRRLPPVLSLTPEHHERGLAVLGEMGVPKDAWYALLHVRSASFNDDGGANHNSLRNAALESYLPAIRRIVEAGGWVLRMGDAGMPPLPAMPGVVDYARSAWKSDWMDAFLCGSSAFAVVTQSGLLHICQAFGVPVVLTNVLPNSILALRADDLVIPRKLHSRAEDRILSFREAYRPPYVNTEVQLALDLLGCEALPHTAMEISDVVGEMVDRHLGRAVYTEADERLQRRFVAGVDYHGFGQIGRIGRVFLRDHMHFL
jgi:putative glycosyltransferase (TIGR04372 family)